MKIKWSRILKDKDARKDLVDNVSQSVNKVVQDGVDAITDVVDDIKLPDPDRLVEQLDTFADKVSDTLSGLAGNLAAGDAGNPEVTSVDTCASAPFLSPGAGLLSAHATRPGCDCSGG